MIYYVMPPPPLGAPSQLRAPGNWLFYRSTFGREQIYLFYYLPISLLESKRILGGSQTHKLAL